MQPAQTSLPAGARGDALRCGDAGNDV